MKKTSNILMEGSRKIYFGHVGLMYNTIYEKRGKVEIENRFPGYEVINPNSPKYDRLYAKHGFDIFFDIIDSCEFGVFMPTLQGKWGVGIYEEAYYFYKTHKKVYEIDPNTYEIRLLRDPTKKSYSAIGLTKKGEVKRRIEQVIKNKHNKTLGNLIFEKENDFTNYKFINLLNESFKNEMLSPQPKNKNDFLKLLLGKKADLSYGSVTVGYGSLNEKNINDYMTDALMHYLLDWDYYYNYIDDRSEQNSYYERVKKYIDKLVKGNWKSFIKYFTVWKDDKEWEKKHFSHITSDSEYKMLVSVEYANGKKLYKDLGGEKLKSL